MSGEGNGQLLKGRLPQGYVGVKCLHPAPFREAHLLLKFTPRDAAYTAQTILKVVVRFQLTVVTFHSQLSQQLFLQRIMLEESTFLCEA